MLAEPSGFVTTRTPHADVVGRARGTADVDGKARCRADMTEIARSGHARTRTVHLVILSGREYCTFRRGGPPEVSVAINTAAVHAATVSLVGLGAITPDRRQQQTGERDQRDSGRWDEMCFDHDGCRYW